MRAKNREINIFNMSLLDILTGMLGAFLFLMLGMLPFYAKVKQNKFITEEEAKKFEELKKLLDAGLKGPLTPEQVQTLQDQMAALEAKVSSLESDVKDAQQQLADQKQETLFWRGQDATVSVNSDWDSDATDIDVMILTPSGRIFGTKKGKILGRDVINEGTDSHTAEYKTSYEGTLVFLSEGSGDYLVFYRVPKDAAPATYANLRGFFFYHETIDKTNATTMESSLGASNASAAKPGGVYAWTFLHYDAAKQSMTVKPAAPPLPDGILLPQ